MKKLLAALLALLCLPVVTALGDTQGDFTYALTPEGAVVTMYYVEEAAQTPAVITVPDALGRQPVVGIGENAFNNSESAFEGALVEAIILPGTLRYLDDGAFTCCHDVKKLYFPASLERIAEGCFSHVTAEIALDPDNPYFTVERGYLIDRRADTLLYAPRLRAGDAIDLPRVRRLGEGALENLYCAATALTIPDNVQSIGGGALANLPYLRALTIPDSVTELEPNSLCSMNLVSLALPGSVKHIPESLCESAALTELTLAEGIETIGDYAFYRTALRQVTLPASVRRVGACAALDGHGGDDRSERAPAAHSRRGARRRGAQYGGRVLSGDVPQPHGLARSARRVHRRGLRRGAGDPVRGRVSRHHPQRVFLRAGGGAAGISYQPQKPSGGGAFHGAGRHDDLVALYCRNVVY